MAPLPVQSVTAAQVLLPDPAAPASLWQWLARLPDPRDPRGVRFTLPCVIATVLAARLAGCDSFTAAGQWAASRPPQVLKALGCPRHKRAGVRVAPSEKTMRRVSGLADHDLADDLLCGWTGELAAICAVLSPAELQERHRAKARKAKARARKAARRERAARTLSGKQARKAVSRRARPPRPRSGTARKPSLAAARNSPQAQPPSVSRSPRRTRRRPPRCTATPDIPALRGLGAHGKAPAPARSKARSTSAPGVLLHGTAERRPARRGPQDKRDDGHSPVIDGMDLARPPDRRCPALPGRSEQAGACPWRSRHLRDQREPAQHLPGLNTIAWEQIPVAAATFEADRGRIETRTIQVAAAPAGLKYPGMRQVALIERYTTFKDKEGKAVTRSETVLILTTADAGQAPPADLLALNRGHWAATEATHYIRDVDLKEDSSRECGPGAARLMATAGNTMLNLLRIHGVTNIAAERRRLHGSDREILKRMGLSAG